MDVSVRGKRSVASVGIDVLQDQPHKLPTRFQPRAVTARGRCLFIRYTIMQDWWVGFTMQAGEELQVDQSRARDPSNQALPMTVC